MRGTAFAFAVSVLAGVTVALRAEADVRTMGPIDVTVKAPTEYFDAPGGKLLGTLETGRNVAIFECRDDGWCSISGGWALGLDPGPGGGANTRTVSEDTDLYDAREGSKIGDFLAVGQQVTTVGQCGNDWCELSNPKGWVWGGHLN